MHVRLLTLIPDCVDSLPAAKQLPPSRSLAADVKSGQINTARVSDWEMRKGFPTMSMPSKHKVATQSKSMSYKKLQ